MKKLLLLITLAGSVQLTAMDSSDQSDSDNQRQYESGTLIKTKQSNVYRLLGKEGATPITRYDLEQYSTYMRSSQRQFVCQNLCISFLLIAIGTVINLSAFVSRPSCKPCLVM